MINFKLFCLHPKPPTFVFAKICQQPEGLCCSVTFCKRASAETEKSQIK